MPKFLNPSYYHFLSMIITLYINSDNDIIQYTHICIKKMTSIKMIWIQGFIIIFGYIHV